MNLYLNGREMCEDFPVQYMVLLFCLTSAMRNRRAQSVFWCSQGCGLSETDSSNAQLCLRRLIELESRLFYKFLSMQEIFRYVSRSDRLTTTGVLTIKYDRMRHHSA